MNPLLVVLVIVTAALTFACARNVPDGFDRDAVELNINERLEVERITRPGRDSARAASVMSEVKIFQTILQQYADEHEGKYPATDRPGPVIFEAEKFPGLGGDGWGKEGAGWYLQANYFNANFTYALSTNQKVYTLEFYLPASTKTLTQPPQEFAAGTHCARPDGMYTGPCTNSE